MELKLADPKGLIRESYRIEGIDASECRSIFLDWALSLIPGTDVKEAVRTLLATYSEDRADHPMTSVLSEALGASMRSGARRGGRAARMAD